MAKQAESLLRAKKKYRETHPKQIKEYSRWYYENFTKPKRASASESRQSA